MSVRQQCEAAELMYPGDWPVLIVTDDGWAHGEKLPAYIGPFYDPADATAWAGKHIESDAHLIMADAMQRQLAGVRHMKRPELTT